MMVIFSNNKYFAILLGRLELHALSPLDKPLVILSQLTLFHKMAPSKS